MTRRLLAGLVAAAFVAAMFGAAAAPAAAAAAPKQAPTRTPIEHLIFLMQENHSFDNYFGTYPGADGIPKGTCIPRDPDKPALGCVRPFRLGGRAVVDLDHRPETHQVQFHGGRMDGFVKAFADRGRFAETAMGYYDGRDIPYYWNVADEYVLFDRFFTSAAGGSVTNHMYAVTGAPGISGKHERIPARGWGDLPTIFDRLQAKGIPWKFYIQNYDPRITYRNPDVGDRGAQIVWAPVLSYARFLDDQKLNARIVDLNELFDDLANDTLPAVSYIRPSGGSEHPPGSIQAGERFVRTLLNALMTSDAWPRTAFIWTYDDWGGWYDHVPPPRVDAHGYGFRAPALLVSAYARRGHVDSTTLDFTSILKFIEHNWRLRPLATRDARANNFLTAFDFQRPPRAPRFLSRERAVTRPPASRRDVIYAAYAAAFALPALLVAWAAFTGRRRREHDGWLE